MKCVVVFVLFFVLHVSVCRIVPLLVPDEGRSELRLSREGLSLLSSLSQQVAIVGVCGPTRSGKSFTLNQILGRDLRREEGFTVGHTPLSTTIGGQLWAPALEGEDGSTSVLLLDTEGGGSDGTTVEYGEKIHLFSILVCSHVIFHVGDVVDTSRLEHLHALASLVRALQGRYPHIVTDRIFGMPPLTWVVAKFHLQNSPGWLDAKLEEKKLPENPTEQQLRTITRFNETVRVVRSVFGKRRVVTLPPPVRDSSLWKRLTDIDPRTFDESYRSQIVLLRKMILQSKARAHMKSGKELGEFMERIVPLVNKFDAERIVDVLLREIVKEAVRIFEETIFGRVVLPVHPSILEEAYLLGKRKARESLVERLSETDENTYLREEYGGELEEKLVVLYENMSARNNDLLFNLCKDRYSTWKRERSADLEKYGGDVMNFRAEFRRWKLSVFNTTRPIPYCESFMAEGNESLENALMLSSRAKHQRAVFTFCGILWAVSFSALRMISAVGIVKWRGISFIFFLGQCISFISVMICVGILLSFGYADSFPPLFFHYLGVVGGFVERWETYAFDLFAVAPAEVRSRVAGGGLIAVLAIFIVIYLVPHRTA